MSEYTDIPLTVNEAAHQLELRVDGHVSKISYDIEGDKVYLASAVVPPELRNRGIAAAMTEKALHWVEDQNRKAIPLCSYIVAYVHRHPEWKRVTV